MSLRTLRMKTFEDATSIASLETAVNAWLKARTEEQLEDWWFETDGAKWWVVILYTES
jgi:hypothetical protein